VGNQAFGGFVTPSRNTYDVEAYSTTPELTGSWSVLNLSALTGRSAAASTLKSARLQRRATRSDVVLDVKRQFYQVVQAVQLARVNTEALKLSRDNERRVRALFEVGSVSKSDVLKAQVQTAQSELDSLTSHQDVTVQRINLASVIGIREPEMGEIDTLLTADVKEFDESALVTEAEKSRPDVMAADAELQAARLGLRSANLARWPYLTVGGSAQFELLRTSSFKQPRTDTAGVEDPDNRIAQNTRSKTDRSIGASIALNWDIFDGLSTDSRIASARARFLRAREARDALRRNLESEVHAALLVYREAIERSNVARRALESAEENLKLTQQKYNVGSATILDLIDSQVQLQRARSQGVAALAAMRVGEAALDRVRGRSE
jgi:outer membrane protein TolC